MAIELAIEGAQVKNGHLQFNGSNVAPIAPVQAKYLKELNDDIAQLTLAESALVESIEEMEQELAQTSLGKKLRLYKAKLKTCRGLRAEAAIKQRGVCESLLQDRKPGSKLIDIVSASLDEHQPKQLGAGRGGKRK